MKTEIRVELPPGRSHGTTAGYHARCRCEECRAAKQASNAHYKPLQATRSLGRPDPTWWRCCGVLYQGPDFPSRCRVCGTKPGWVEEPNERITLSPADRLRVAARERLNLEPRKT